MSAEVISDLLEQSKAPMKPAKRSELLGGKRMSLDQLEYEDEMGLEEE